MIDDLFDINERYNIMKKKIYLYESTDIPIKTLLIPQLNSNTISIGIFISAGSRQETEAYGIAHFLEHMTFKGTIKRTSEKLMIELDSIGAQYNAMTGHEFTLYYISGNPNDINILLDIILDLYINPIYPEQDIYNEKNVILEELRMNDDNNHKLLSKKIYENIFKDIDETLARPIIGYKEYIDLFNKKNIINFRNNNYKDNCLLCISGYFNRKKIIKIINNILNTTYHKKHISSKLYYDNIIYDNKLINLLDLNKNIKNYIHYDKNINQSIINFCFNCYNTYNKNNDIVDLICDILSNGFSSRLFNLLRNKLGVSYYNNSYSRIFSDYGLMFISVGVEHKTVVNTIKEILNELKILRKYGITNDELLKVKKQNETALLFNFKDSYEYLIYYGKNYLDKKPLYNISDMINNIEKINLDEINTIITKLFNSRNIIIGTIGNISESDQNNIIKLLEDF